jgi:hypothetical protein
MENTHEFKAVHNPLFCKERDILFNINTDKEHQSTKNKFYNPGDIPVCNPKNDCSVIQDLLNEKTNELETIKNQFDLAFKDRSRLRILREYISLQLKDIDADLDVVRKTIETLDDRYLKYIKNNV